MKTVLVDMDQTLNRFWETYVDFYNYETHATLGRYERIERDQLHYYNIEENFPDHDKRTPLYGKIFAKKSFWREMNVLDEFEFDAFREICSKYNTYICTVPFKGADCCASEKIRWVRKHFPFFDTSKIIFTRDKYMIKADLLIDDAPEHLEKFPSNKLIIDYPYNKHIDGQRVRDWSEVVQTVENILKE